MENYGSKKFCFLPSVCDLCMKVEITLENYQPKLSSANYLIFNRRHSSLGGQKFGPQ